MASNDTTKLVLGAAAGALAGYFISPRVLDRVLPQVEAPQQFMSAEDMTMQMSLYTNQDRQRNSYITMGSYGAAIACALLGGYIGKSLG